METKNLVQLQNLLDELVLAYDLELLLQLLQLLSDLLR
jgi:hypothetical protein